MFAVASAVQDVSQLPMSGFSVCTVSLLLGWRKLLIRDRCPNDGSCYFLYADSCYFISMLTAVQEQRSRLFFGFSDLSGTVWTTCFFCFCVPVCQWLDVCVY